MDKKNEYYLKTGEKKMMDEWVNNHYPESAKKAIVTYLPDYRHIARFRVNTGNPQVSSLDENVHFVLNYNCDRKCFIVWNAAVQRSIHQPKDGKSIQLTVGAALKNRLHQRINSDATIRIYQEIRGHGDTQVELVLIVGEDALVDFLRNYQELLKPIPTEIKKGKACLYAVAGGEVEYIQGEQQK